MGPTSDAATRILIFLVFGMCGGVPAVSWSLRVLFLHVRAGGRVSIFIIFLIISDILELFIIPFIIGSIVSLDMFCRRGPNPVFFVFAGTRVCGFCFHQLVALESILSLMHPHCVSRLSSPFCSIPICLTIWIYSSIFNALPLELSFALLAGTVLGIVALLTCVFTVKASCSSGDPEATSDRDRRTRLRVLAVAMGTLWILYAPFFVWLVVSSFGSPRLFEYFGYMTVCIMSFRVVADPLLVVLVCRENPQRQPTQTGIELNTVQTSN